MNETVTRKEEVGRGEKLSLLEAPEGSVVPQKRIFVGLLMVTCLVLAGLAFFLWWVPYVGLSNIHPGLPTFLGLALALMVLVVFAGALLLIVTIVAGRDLLFSKKLRGAVIKVMFPILVAVGKLFGISRERISQSFVAINNQLVLTQNLKVEPSRLLLLMPHCLQNYDCEVKITGNVENCKSCGKCPIKDLLALSRKYKVELAVATGGTIARRIVVQKRPQVIVAVACERDLTSGIQDTYPLPVYGIFNRRLYGPCFNTQLPLPETEAAIRLFLGQQA